MFRFFRIFAFPYYEKKLILGRWNYVKDNEELQRKIYLANIDHCGPCGKLDLRE